MNKEKKEVVKVNQITEGVIWQQILIFFLPILFGTFFQQLYNTADAMIVGKFVGKEFRTSIAILDEGFAKQIIKYMSLSENMEV